jgi:hypothetical protein
MSGRALIIMIVGMVLISTNIFLQLTGSSRDMSDNMNRTYVREAASNIAQSGVSIGVRRLVDDPLWRDGVPMMALLGGNAIITVRDTVYHTRPAIQVQCTGIMMYSLPDEHREVVTAYVYGDTIPHAVQAVLSTPHNVSQTGAFELDGRDHDRSGNHKPGSKGTKAVWTERDCEHTVGTRFHGEGDDGEDHDDVDVDTTLVERGKTYPGGYPRTPDSIMTTCGHTFPEGTLKLVAKSHSGGSQYVTDPGLLTFPLKGVTYVDLPAGGTWNVANVTGSGLLIVHNSTRDACMKDANGGPFTGLVICDEIQHINATIVGAVISCGDDDNDNTASGSGQLLFSRDAIRSATTQAVHGACANKGSSKTVIAMH